jgi:acyl carrier protein
MLDLKALQDVFVKTFPTAVIPDNFSDLRLGDFEEWDSLGNFNLLLAIEEMYEIRFDIEDMSALKSVQDFSQRLVSLGVVTE